MVTIFDVADFFIKKSHDNGRPVTHLKLQKLCYYAKAWNLAINDEPLFNGDFEAWVHGPVNPELFKEYREYGWEPIRNVKKPNKVFNPEQKKVLDAVWLTYHRLDARDLENLTHQERPWKEARGNLPSHLSSNNRIKESTMKSFYRKLRIN